MQHAIDHELKMFTSLVFFASLLLQNDCARILAMYPTPSVSHQVVFRPLMLELAKLGHDVTVITADPIKTKIDNFTEINVHDLSYDYWKKYVIPHIDSNPDNSFNIIQTSMHGLVDVLEQQFKTEAVQKILNSNQKYDLIFVEAFMKPCLILAHVFDAPVIQFSSFTSMYPMCDVMGAPSHLLYYPEIIHKKLYNRTLWDKLVALYDDFRFKRIIRNVKYEENAMLKRTFGSNAPTIDELTQRVDLLFLNVHSIWDDNRPMPPAVIYTGGLHQIPEKALPKDLKSYLDNSKHGVIYMSFGSNVDPTTLSPDRIKVFCNVFSRMSYDVLWKWNGDELPGKPKNVRISKWLPQPDLLRHPKIKVFITQAGLQSTDEAITAGVPLIAFPMLGDQWYNAEKYKKHGIGVEMVFETVTEDELEKTLRNVIADKKYQESIIRLRSLMRDQPQSPLQRAVWWTEHVLRHRGARHLRAPLANVTWAEYLMLDVVFTLLGSVMLALIVGVFVLKKAFTSKKNDVKLKKK